jgi:hypothetical protein
MFGRGCASSTYGARYRYAPILSSAPEVADLAPSHNAHNPGGEL